MISRADDKCQDYGNINDSVIGDPDLHAFCLDTILPSHCVLDLTCRRRRPGQMQQSLRFPAALPGKKGYATKE
jgi:hypothetical protein